MGYQGSLRSPRSMRQHERREYVHQMRDNQGNLSPDIKIIRDNLITAWAQFKENPHAWAGVDRSQSLATYRKNIS
jgi:hypothetical protein